VSQTDVIISWYRVHEVADIRESVGVSSVQFSATIRTLLSTASVTKAVPAPFTFKKGRCYRQLASQWRYQFRLRLTIWRWHQQRASKGGISFRLRLTIWRWSTWCGCDGTKAWQDVPQTIRVFYFFLCSICYIFYRLGFFVWNVLRISYDLVL